MGPEEESLPPREENIGTKFLSRLEERGLVIQTPEFESVGIAADTGTNEKGNPILFEKVRRNNQAPNGYLIGIGAANVFSMLEAFPEGITPKAIILFDIDPAVVAYSQRLIQSFKDTPPDPSIWLESWDRIFHSQYQASPENAIKKYSPILHQLAKEGNLVIARAEFSNLQLVDELADLPDFKISNNVIYLSNIADHIWRRSPNTIPNFSFLQTFEPTSPHKNFYIDTLQNSLNYNLRISTHPPQFEPRNFSSNIRLAHLQTELTDRVGEEQENILWEDIEGWSVDKLITYYNRLLNSPAGQERKKETVSSIDRIRAHILEQYPELKKKSTMPPDRTRRIETRVMVPTDPQEEKALLAELAQPYDYERYLIPFIARNYWRDAKTPEDLNPWLFPEREALVFDEQTYKVLYRREDPRDWTIGKVETWALKPGITYEELSMAKLYKEMERRVLARRSGAQTQGKTFLELFKESTAPY